MTHRDPNTVQVGGNHYTKLAHQPDELTLSYDLNGLEHSVVKYFTRWKDKDGLKDLQKGRHYIEKLLHAEEQVTLNRLMHPRPALRLRVEGYVEKNGLDPREAMVVVLICRWRISSEAKHLRTALEAALDLIHDARMSGDWEE